MSKKEYKFLSKISLLTGSLFLGGISHVNAQQNISVEQWQSLYQHGIEQYHKKHYDLAAESLQSYIDLSTSTILIKSEASRNQPLEEAKYYLILSNLQRKAEGSFEDATSYLQTIINPFYKQRVAFSLAQNFFQENYLSEAITYYEMAGVDNLSNDEVADAKFELAYSYFNNQSFQQAKPLFRAIKDLPDHKYYLPGNYYYGLLAYNDQNYEEAIKSFNRIEHEELYQGVVPYYKAEIYYFQNQPEKVLAISKDYLSQKVPGHYEKEMHLLTAQTYFEQEDYVNALPHFEFYYDHSEEIRKEELYEFAFTYYKLEEWSKAVEMFQPLSNAQDTLGQTSMYLLGDCYLKLEDKRGARNAFGICMDMDYNQQQKEAAMFLYSKLSFELGDESMAMRRFNEFIQKYPHSEFNSEAKGLLSHLLTKNNDYEAAFNILSDLPPSDAAMWSIYQQVTVGRAMQLLQQRDYSQADELLNLSLQQPNNPYFEAIAYFWKSEIAYTQQRYDQAIQYGQQFLMLAKGNERNIQEINSEVTVANAHFNIGHAYLAQDQFSLAQNSFANARKKPAAGLVENKMMQADATLREADMLFMQNDYQEALKLYNLAISQEVSSIDYANFQKAMLLGLLKDQGQQKNILQQLSHKTASAYRYPATLELANLYAEEGSFETAIDLFNQVYKAENITPHLQSKALLGLAYSYNSQNRLQMAKESYQQYLEQYPNAADKDYVMDALGTVYMKEGNPEGYFNYLRSHNIAEVDEATVENTYYDAALRYFAQSDFQSAEQSFTRYLNEYPEGIHAIKAHYYRGEARFSNGNLATAQQDFIAVMNQDWSEFTEVATSKAADIAWLEEDYESAYQYYTKLIEVAINQEVLHRALVGAAKSAYEIGAFDDAYQYAETVLALHPNATSVKEEAELIKAHVLLDRAEFSAATEYYDKLKSSKMPAISAPALYHLAYIEYRQGKMNQAEEKAAFSAQNSSGQEYWAVNSYLLLAQILFDQQDYFNAKALLQGIVSDPSKNEKILPLKREAQLLLDQTIKEERAQSKLKE